MAMVKIGKTYYSDQPKDIYLICGNAVRDGETFDAKGNALGKVTVAAQEHEDGNTLFVRLCGWRGKAKDVAAVRKMDCVLAVGALSKNEYNEKTYYDLDVDFIAVSGVKRGGASQDFSAPAGFDEIEELGDGELPF